MGKHLAVGFRRGFPRKLLAALADGPDAVLTLIASNCDVTDSGCHIWRGTKSDSGYGILVDPRLPMKRGSPPRLVVSRLVCEMRHGTMPDDWQARHQCHTPSCVNPAHILPGTRSENLNDSVRDGRWTFVRGEGNGRAKIGWAEVEAIRASYVRNTPGWCAETAGRYGISVSTLRKITGGQTWTAKPDDTFSFAPPVLG